MLLLLATAVQSFDGFVQMYPQKYITSRQKGVCLHTPYPTPLQSATGYIINLLFDGYEGNMTGYCMSVRPYFHKPHASENTAQGLWGILWASIRGI